MWAALLDLLDGDALRAQEWSETLTAEWWAYFEAYSATRASNAERAQRAKRKRKTP